MRYYYFIETSEETRMKIKIIDVSHKQDVDCATLGECGFEIGDIVDVENVFEGGYLSIVAIRDGSFVKAGRIVGIYRPEYEVVEE